MTPDARSPRTAAPDARSLLACDNCHHSLGEHGPLHCEVSYCICTYYVHVGLAIEAQAAPDATRVREDAHVPPWEHDLLSEPDFDPYAERPNLTASDLLAIEAEAAPPDALREAPCLNCGHAPDLHQMLGCEFRGAVIPDCDCPGFGGSA